MTRSSWRSSTRPGIILMYHRVWTPVVDSARLCVTPLHFAEHLETLANERVVPLAELPDTPGGIAITFDDGYLDNLEAALPLLEEFRLPATFFITTSVLDGCEFWWDRVDDITRERERSRSRIERSAPYRLYRRFQNAREMARLRGLDQEQLERDEALAGASVDVPCAEHRKLDEAGLRRLASSEYAEIGGHTRTHPNLTTLSEQAQREEVAASREQLEAIIGGPVRTFSYPYGAHDEVSVRTAERAGFELACIVGGGGVTQATDRMRLPRYPVRDLPGSVFHLQLAMWKSKRRST
jgi:peptidoglycan/xylan/chitin deacetylase (PgdA/CDA1 family)